MTKFSLGVVNGLDIRKLLQSEEFSNVLIGKELIAWDNIKAVIETLLGKHRSQNYSVFVRDMLHSFHELKISMTLKVHFQYHHHLDRLANQLSTESDGQGERFHQTIKPMESRLKGKKVDSMLGELCWWSRNVYKYRTQNHLLDELDDDDILYESDESN